MPPDSGPPDSGPPWPARLHALWQAAFAAVNTKGLSGELYSGLLSLPGTRALLGARLAPDGAVTVTRWATAEHLETLPDGLAAEVHAWLAAHPRPAAPTGHAMAVEALTPERLRAESPALGARFDGTGAAGLLVGQFEVAGGERGLLVLAVTAGAGPELTTALRQVRDVVVATDLHASQQRELDDRQVQDAILAEASLRMSASLDIDDTLRSVVRIVVPGLADGAAIHVVREGRVVPIAVAHVDARREPALAAHLRSGRWAGEQVLSGSDPSTWDEQPRPSGLPEDTRLPLMTIIVLRARGREVGLLTFFRRHAPTRHTGPALLRDLASRAALAIDNADLYEQRRRAVLSLQEHLLPSVLPSLAGLECAAAYNVADHSLDVGGDFYGVVPLDGGRVTALIGDVCGRGAPAAALTGLARHTLETALEDGIPAERAVLGLNAKLLRHDVDRFLTLAAATFEPVARDGVRLGLLAAGHPPPMILRHDGSVREATCSGRLVGVLPDLRLRLGTEHLAPGDSVILYTDGLTEARDAGGQFFETDLAPTLSRLAHLPLAELVAELADGTGRYRVGDDAAVLAVRVPEAAR